ncbi:MAG: endonuclease MutS2, partial [Candidatus Poribacteria bacterium]|nr:endonuclease MutS2 [Candidatus Poribacteria bacterium]
VETALEFDKLKNLLKRYTVSELGNARVDKLAPSDSLDIVRNLLKLCTEVKTFQQQSGDIPLNGLTDIGQILRQASISGAILEPEAFLNVVKVAELPFRIKKKFNNLDREDFPRLLYIVDSLPVFDEIVKIISYCISPEGTVLDRASSELRAIRRKLIKSRENIHQKLEAILRSPEHQKSIQESVITFRNNRYVIPIKQDARPFFSGVVQGQSTSGATYFMEPLSIVEMNNALHEAVEAENREIRKILLDLTDRIRERIDDFESALNLLAELDFLNAKARFSHELNAVEPKLNANGVVNLSEARHPLLEFQVRANSQSQKQKISEPAKPKHKQPTRVVPTDVRIGKGFKTLVITGPNTGGKTVVLKTVGLLCLMAQSGLHIPAASGSKLPIFHHIFADIGDDQNIEQSLSTFSSHITKIAVMLNAIEDSGSAHTLVLLDEIGAGTDPTEGTALGMAILAWLSEQNVSTIVTTHYGALKAYTHTQNNMENASMEFDWSTLKPTYRLKIGVPGSSNALKIAEQLGLPSRILADAESNLEKNNIAVEDLLIQLQQTQRELDTEREQLHEKIRLAETEYQKHKELIDTFETEQKTRLQDAEKEALEIVSTARRTVDNIVADIRREQASKASIREAFTKIETAKKQLKPDPPKKQTKKNKLSVKVGDKVRIIKLNRFGQVTTIDKHGSTPLQVRVGSMQMNLSYNDIDNVVPKKESQNLTASVLEMQYNKANSVQEELCIHGMLVKEGLDITDKYLDDAYLAGLLTVRILHGKGTGALRSAVHEVLNTNPHVANYQYAPHSEGGEGVTVVKFKE